MEPGGALGRVARQGPEDMEPGGGPGTGGQARTGGHGTRRRPWDMGSGGGPGTWDQAAALARAEGRRACRGPWMAWRAESGQERATGATEPEEGQNRGSRAGNGERSGGGDPQAGRPSGRPPGRGPASWAKDFDAAPILPPFPLRFRGSGARAAQNLPRHLFLPVSARRRPVRPESPFHPSRSPPCPCPRSPRWTVGNGFPVRGPSVRPRDRALPSGHRVIRAPVAFWLAAQVPCPSVRRHAWQAS
jgi:hypothetical protein